MHLADMLICYVWQQCKRGSGEATARRATSWHAWETLLHFMTDLSYACRQLHQALSAASSCTTVCFARHVMQLHNQVQQAYGTGDEIGRPKLQCSAKCWTNCLLSHLLPRCMRPAWGAVLNISAGAPASQHDGISSVRRVAWATAADAV